MQKKKDFNAEELRYIFSDLGPYIINPQLSPLSITYSIFLRKTRPIEKTNFSSPERKKYSLSPNRVLELNKIKTKLEMYEQLAIDSYESINGNMRSLESITVTTLPSRKEPSIIFNKSRE